MIAVIADDFTGAAEIGGIGLRHGLSVIIETEAIRHDNVDLLIIATDTRSLGAREAAGVVSRITARLMDLNPGFIYKKLDSVLRGNVYDELVSQMEVMQLKKAVVVAANPIFKRVIKDGEYFIDEQPLHKTHFSIDPEFPVQSSSVKKIIGEKEVPLITSVKALDVLPSEGIVVGDVIDLNDLDNWCIQIDSKTMPAGASGFFNSLLLNKIGVKEAKETVDIPFQEKALYVLGSSYPKEIDFEETLASNGIFLSHMPEEIYYNKDYDSSWFEKWVENIVSGMKKHNRVVVAVPYRTSTEEGIGERIKQVFGRLIKDVLQKVTLHELLIEGGSTTSVVLNHLGVRKLFPIQEFETGIIRMKIDGYPNLCLTTKPGSYSWPENVWVNNNMTIEN